VTERAGEREADFGAHLHLVDAGHLHFTGRASALIKTAGSNVSPAEVESVLLEHPKVQDCGVVGRPDGECGEAPCAFVVLRPGNDSSTALEAELCGHVAERLTKYKQPREIRFVSGIPRNPSGKILRRELRAQL